MLPSLHLSPIGYVQTGKRHKFDAPHQPNPNEAEQNQIVLEEGRQFDLAIQDLDGFERIWLIFWFHKNQNWRPRVLPPRGPAQRRGVFSTRSPHRPNPIGITCVNLLSIDNLILNVGPLDLVDATPILDIKPYLPRVDAFPDSQTGWIGEVEAMLEQTPEYQIEIQSFAENQLNWLRDTWNIDFTERAFGILTSNPWPHRTRRILQVEPGLFRMACGPWRLYYRIAEQTIHLESIAKGYSDETLLSKGYENITDRDAQLAFAATFG